MEIVTIIKCHFATDIDIYQSTEEVKLLEK